ncbi:trypsin-like peptidase domain-containing protein [Candidatus Dojkabacteria bacterium]|nr:trypsin-like peptidase domain-containing protein [Candidatus Dojkabacteria bacterium]
MEDKKFNKTDQKDNEHSHNQESRSMYKNHQMTPKGEVNIAKDNKIQGSKKPDKTDNKDNKEPRFKIVQYIRLFGYIISLTIMLFIGVYIGATFVPVVRHWLEDHNFIEDTYDREDPDSSSKASNSENNSKNTIRNVVVEENFVIDVVDETKDGVVTVAIKDSENTSDSYNIGTGFIIDESGLVLTNQHVVSNTSSNYIVITSDGKKYEVEDIARDNVNDIAILKIDGKDFNALALGNSDDLLVGQYVVAIGTPLGNYPGSVTTGIISGLGRSVTAATSEGFWSTSRTYEDVIQTDASVNPGNSGGPLLDSDGNVIGINFTKTVGADNISFALPINKAKGRISEYKKNGKFIQPYLGVEYSLVTDYSAIVEGNLVYGADVKRVSKNSPAEKAGIKIGDIITQVDGKDIVTSFSDIIQTYDIGDKVEMKILRDGKYINVDVTLEEAE